MKTYSTVGGTDGNEEGKLVAKKLRTIFFSEHVLTLFSWTGMSRTPGMAKKESFQVCGGIIKLFQQIISMADSRWSSTKNEKFFKYNTLKHAKQIEKAQNKKVMKKMTKKHNRSMKKKKMMTSRRMMRKQYQEI